MELVGLADTATDRTLLRHALATLAYRAAKVLREPPDGFAAFRAAADVRTPLDIVGHLGDLLEWGERAARGDWSWQASAAGTWTADVDRFFAAIARLDAYLASSAPLGNPADRLLQGPVADALTHVGQLAMLRRMAGAPLRPESYARAEIQLGRTGLDQPSPKFEFDGMRQRGGLPARSRGGRPPPTRPSPRRRAVVLPTACAS
jgi:hypothetical protein